MEVLQKGNKLTTYQAMTKGFIVNQLQLCRCKKQRFHFTPTEKQIEEFIDRNSEIGRFGMCSKAVL